MTQMGIRRYIRLSTACVGKNFQVVTFYCTFVSKGVVEKIFHSNYFGFEQKPRFGVSLLNASTRYKF